jgi:hypothetical protein
MRKKNFSCTVPESNDKKLMIMPLSRWLWNLPEVLINHVLSLWIGVRDIGHLDSAMCGNIIRDNFLRFIHVSGLTIHQCYEPHELKNAGDLTNQFMVWIVKRNLALTELTVTPTFALNKHSRRSTCSGTAYESKA